MKNCPGCKADKPLDHYIKTKSRCKACRSKDKRKYYEDNRDDIRKKKNARRQKIKNWLRTLKTSYGCQHCGEKETSTLDYHHTDPLTKEYNLKDAHKTGRSIKRIMDEVNKCIVLCKTCHIKEHKRMRMETKLHTASHTMG